jgi:hypothetical protein
VELPAQRHNDFIFAIIGEELGFLGAFAVLALFATLAYTGCGSPPHRRPVAAYRRRHVDDLAGRPGRHQHRLRRGAAAGDRAAAAADLLGGTSLVVTMFVFGVLANAARHEPEAVATLTRGGAVTGRRRRRRLLRIRAPALPGSSSRSRGAGRGGGRDACLVVVGGRGRRAHRAGAGASPTRSARLRRTP